MRESYPRRHLGVLPTPQPRAHRQGHELGNHSNHPQQTGSGADLDATSAFIESHFGTRPYTSYAKALRRGFPIAMGVVEEACRYLVKDHMDRTGARWALAGAEAVLRLRALVTNGNFDQYWRFHLAQERERNHRSRYSNGTVPNPLPGLRSARPKLRRIK
ncbi:MAG: hypothetical protein JW751_13510 [Polyangiaceae bacterium]|nr:hypothetical protein [Polyangiaceae bacterium]